ncbi:hypothetical protein OWV82_010230 [Melia azedarach]|uniref:Uncharacterized protein n=1 Tax=Melia azedarach TaxID=155640 RepID=A0ACC1Y4A4_MELAZ|nr:hypothetical protein OWV82_010230 [Melia azedarach]
MNGNNPSEKHPVNPQQDPVSERCVEKDGGETSVEDNHRTSITSASDVAKSRKWVLPFVGFTLNLKERNHGASKRSKAAVNRTRTGNGRGSTENMPKRVELPLRSL